MVWKSGKNVSELVRIALLGLEKDFSTSFENAKKVGNQQSYKEGYEKGQTEWASYVTCSICKKPIYFKSEDELHRDIIYMTRGKYSHRTCV
jgi:hypothetical protein